MGEGEHISMDTQRAGCVPGTHLSGLGGGLDEGDVVAAGQVLGLLGVHCPGREVTLVAHQDHGHVLRVLHPLDLLSGTRRELLVPRDCSETIKQYPPLLSVSI